MLHPIDLHTLNNVGPELIVTCDGLLHLYQFGETTAEHVGTLASLARIQPGSRVIDLGSGVGGFSRIAQQLVPDASFTLVNLAERQHDFAPEHMQKLVCDFTRVPLPDSSFDSAVAIFSFSQVEDVKPALAEAFRLLCPGGTLLVYDVLRVSGDNSRLDKLCCKARTERELSDAALACGFTEAVFVRPSTFTYTLKDQQILAEVLKEFEGTAPGIWQVRKPVNAFTSHRPE